MIKHKKNNNKVHIYNIATQELTAEQKETIKKLYPDRDVLFFEFAETEFRKKRFLIMITASIFLSIIVQLING